MDTPDRLQVSGSSLCYIPPGHFVGPLNETFEIIGVIVTAWASNNMFIRNRNDDSTLLTPLPGSNVLIMDRRYHV